MNCLLLGAAGHVQRARQAGGFGDVGEHRRRLRRAGGPRAAAPRGSSHGGQAHRAAQQPEEPAAGGCRGARPITLAVRRGAAAPRATPRRFLSSSLDLALEALEDLERLLALVRPPEAPVHAGQHVVVRGRARVEGDRAVQRVHRVLEPPLALVGARPSGTTHGRTSGRARAPCRACSSAFVRIARAVVVRAQVDVRRGERALALLVQRRSPSRTSPPRRIVAERLEREPERVDALPRTSGRCAAPPRTPCAPAPSCPGSRRACRDCSGALGGSGL